jgi:hypothetical protein
VHCNARDNRARWPSGSAADGARVMPKVSKYARQLMFGLSRPRNWLYANTQIPAPTTNATAPSTIASSACRPLPSIPARRRPSSPSVKPSPPRIIGALSQKASTPTRPRMPQTRPTLAGRLPTDVARQAQPPSRAKSPMVRAMTKGTRTWPSLSVGQSFQMGLSSFLTASR